MQNAALYALTCLIWGSTWLAITFQLGVVDPVISVVYRFALAAGLLLAFSLVRRLPLRFGLAQHGGMALQGLTLFSLNYIAVYVAELTLTSGLVAVVFSLIVVFNVFLSALFLGNPIRPRVLLGGLLGIAGLALVFQPQLTGFDLSRGQLQGLAWTVGGTLIASLGNIVAARNQRQGLPIVQSNAYGMAYGALITLIIGLFRGAPLTFSVRFEYIGSLLYLAAVGSVVAFGAYLTLLGRIGPDRSAYIAVVFPVVALALSTLFEQLRWEWLAVLGVGLVVVGNALALTGRRAAPRPLAVAEGARPASAG
jgi:drug/metabolite transporter (DMT)-like permease